MTAENRGNPARMGLVSILGNSADEARDENLPELVNFEWNRCWTSENTANSWIQFDFNTKSIVVHHYTIKTYWLGPGYSHLRSWVVEGCGISGVWELLDSREDAPDLNGRSRVQTFAIPGVPLECRMIRIRQTGKNHHGDHYLIICNVEFFGDLI
jgi:hypothetical protein